MIQHRWVQGWHLNAFGGLFGGQLLSWVDEDTNMLTYNSSIVGTSHTTVGYERVSFLHPCVSGDRLSFAYDIVHYGKRSVTVRVVVFNQKKDKIFSCLTTMVRTDSIEGIGLLPEVIDKIDKNSKYWKLVERLKEMRKNEGEI